MITVYEQFLFNLAQINSYISNLEKINNLISNKKSKGNCNEIKGLIKDINTQLEQFRLKKVFEYNSIIISLYGFFERFVEHLIISYLSEINNLIPSYSHLPDIIKENHFNFSAVLLKNLTRRKYQNLTTSEEIIRNLYSCIENINFKINTHAYIEHPSNFKHQIICTLFKEIGINDLTNKIKQNKKFSTYLLESYRGRQIERITEETLFDKLSELAERRNDIAHGVNRSDILHPTILKEFIDFVKLYGTTLFEITIEEILEIQTIWASIKFEKIHGIHNNKILCAEVEKLNIAIGDTIIAKTKDKIPSYLIRRVVDIQIENISHKQVNITESKNIGIKMNDNIKKNQEFYLIKRDSLNYP